MKPCNTYSIQGGVCTLEQDHSGLHNASGYYEWTDEESISKEKADEIFLLESKFMGLEGFAQLLINLTDIN